MTTYQLFIVIFLGTLVGLVLGLSIVAFIRVAKKRRKITKAIKDSISIRFDGAKQKRSTNKDYIIYYYTILIKGNEVVDLVESEEPLSEKQMESIKDVIAERRYEETIKKLEREKAEKGEND